MDHDKRALKRRHLTRYPAVIDVNTGRQVGRVVDVTIEGMSLISPDPVETGTVFQLKMPLREITLGSTEISFDANGIWCGKDVNPDYYCTGFQLTQVSEHDKRVIDYLIQRSSFRD